jgi:cell division protein FtsI (penicillin-binding protein 3)
VSVTLLQLARAYSVFARGGQLVPVSLVRSDSPPTPVRVMSETTAASMRKMLEMAVSDEGTAPAARVAGYRVAGKTGTAYKIRNGQYVREYVSSFVGFAPVSDPKIVVAVMVDEPGGGVYYGGQVAAPVFAQVVSATLRTLQVAPDGALETPKTPLLALRESR